MVTRNGTGRHVGSRLAPGLPLSSPWLGPIGSVRAEHDDDHCDSVALGPLRIARLSRRHFVARIQAQIVGGAGSRAYCFCNAHMAEIAFADPDYRAALKKFFVVHDGVGVDLAARVLDGRPFIDNLNGTDTLPYLFGSLQRPARLYLLGAAPGIAEEAGRRLAARFPNLTLVGARDGFFSADQESDIVAGIAQAAPDILLVALGNPKQETFIARHLDGFNARAVFGVGAFLDFSAGKVARAPAWLRALKLEWLFRLGQEPRRLCRRYTVEIVSFLWTVGKLRFTKGLSDPKPLSAALENR
jgi:exopolysaccharide biosynthesis WecB/TagA/CpsF family protein